MKIQINGIHEYCVVAEQGAMDTCGEQLRAVFGRCKIAVITDDNVAAIYSERVQNVLCAAGFEVCLYVIPHGEQSKSLSVYEKILEFLVQNNITRSDAVLALGGGVVGDLAGFVAATYMRGIGYAQMPTTLLSACDSSVGGKTAIDTGSGKNIIGAFYDPEIVIFDSNALRTLTSEVFFDGMGEIAKYCLLCGDIVLPAKISANTDMADIVVRCIDFKRKVVKKDPFDRGERMLLNLGHTPAHAIERMSGYSIAHGTAVAMGLKIIADACLHHGVMNQKHYDDVTDILSRCGVLHECPYSQKDIVRFIASDKKCMGNDINLVLLDKPGRAFVKKFTLHDAEVFLC